MAIPKLHVGFPASDTGRPRYVCVSEVVAGSEGDPAHSYYKDAITLYGGTDGWATNIIDRSNILDSYDRCPHTLIIFYIGGLDGGLNQNPGLPLSGDATYGGAVMAAAIGRIVDESAFQRIIVYTGPPSVGISAAAAALLFDPIKDLGVRIVVDGASTISEADLITIDAACEQTVGIEGMATLTGPTETRARLSVQLNGQPNPWDPDTYTGGTTGSIRSDSFPTLDTITGETIAYDLFASTQAEIERRAIICWDLGMSVIIPLWQWEANETTEEFLDRSGENPTVTEDDCTGVVIRQICKPPLIQPVADVEEEAEQLPDFPDFWIHMVSGSSPRPPSVPPVGSPNPPSGGPTADPPDVPVPPIYPPFGVPNLPPGGPIVDPPDAPTPPYVPPIDIPNPPIGGPTADPPDNPSPPGVPPTANPNPGGGGVGVF